MDLAFIRRSIIASLVLTGFAFLGLSAYGKSDWAWGVGLGSLWACLNWWLISAVVQVLLVKERRLSGPSKVRLAVLMSVKFPVLYGTGYLLLRLGFPVLSLLAGFWIILGVVTAKAAGRLILGMDPVPEAGPANRSGGASA
jgi:hypothetical protein